jgi:hypothetical protein
MENYDLEMHCHPVLDGTTGTLRGTMIHRDFDNLDHYFERHNIYSQWEALLRTRDQTPNRAEDIRPRLFGSAMERRRFLKRLFLSTPGKPFVYFVYSYILRCGFLDGRPGFIYNVLKSMYWYQISVKEYELKQKRAYL